ncbi:MAG: two-component regulator propeller domain-containing protein [Bacteroidales bacterium]
MPDHFPEKKIISIAVISLIFFVSVQSQEYQFRNFGIEEGIPHRYVYTINQDQSGYLWIGTTTDLARFNGFEFESNPTNDSLPADFVITSFKDSRNRIWFGHNNGSVSVMENNRIRIIDNKGIQTKITGITEDKEGNILIASQQHGLLIADNNMNTLLYRDSFHSTPITSMALAGDNELLIGTFEGLYSYSYAPGEEPGRQHLISDIPATTIENVTAFNEKGIFVGTRDRGLFHLERGPGGLYSSTDTGSRFGYGYTNVQSVFIDDRENLWVSTWGEGVYRIGNFFNQDSNPELKSYSVNNGLTSDHVYEVFQDSEGNYWFATFNGLSMLSDETFSFYRSFDEPFGNNVLSVHSDEEHIWLGGESGLLRIPKNNNGSTMFYGTQRGLPFDAVTAITSCHENNIWIGTAGNGIYRLDSDDQKITEFHVSANSLENTINDLACNKGILRAATSNGVLEFNLIMGEMNRYSTNEGLPHNSIRSIYLDNEGISWIATRSNRLLDAENKNVKRIAGIELDFVSIAQDNKGRMWTATNGNGIIKITNDTIVQITTDEGLHSNYCYSLITGAQGDIWVGHRLGISRVDPDSYFVRTYGTENAIRGDVNFNATHKTSDGVLLFGTTGGLVSYDPSVERTGAEPPLLNITSIEISDEDYEATDEISLPYGSYKLRIEFIGLSYSEPEKVQYQYKLEGYDLDWSDPSGQRFAYYPRLDDGNFEFLLRAVNAEGLSTGEQLMISVRIDKPIWKKWYFFLSVAAIVGLLLFLIIKIRERNLRVEKERIEKELAIRTREVLEQKSEIEHKNKDITDSINYAQRIQASILPPITKIEENFRESFVFYKPRDIVSGDFYWFDIVNENKFLIVCADSTGHGVPGAFMSMIGTTLIKDICMRPDVNSPSDVLLTLDREITSTLNQNIDPTGKSTDGMDITVCEFDIKSRYLRFASAMRPIMMLHKGELSYIRGSRNSIGGYYTEQKEFENKGYQLQPGDIIYLFSDGYPDQFGGPLGKKYKMVRLKNLLADICDKTMKEQYEHVRNNFNLWKGDQEQVDDVLFMGIKV